MARLRKNTRRSRRVIMNQAAKYIASQETRGM